MRRDDFAQLEVRSARQAGRFAVAACELERPPRVRTLGGEFRGRRRFEVDRRRRNGGTDAPEAPPAVAPQVERPEVQPRRGPYNDSSGAFGGRHLAGVSMSRGVT